MIPWAKVLETCLSFSKKYWKEILLVSCMAALFVKMQIDYRSLEKAYSITEESLKNQLATIRELHAEELKLRDEAVEKYKLEIEKIEREYEESRAELDELQRKEVETIAEEIVTRKQFSENKRELADKISLEFGFEYAP